MFYWANGIVMSVQSRIILLLNCRTIWRIIFDNRGATSISTIGHFHCSTFYREFNRTTSTILMKIKCETQEHHEESTLCTYIHFIKIERERGYVKIASVSSFTMSHVSHNTTSSLFHFPKASRACAMFWMTAYWNWPPLCSLVTYLNLILLRLFCVFYFSFPTYPLSLARYFLHFLLSLQQLENPNPE